MRVCGDLADKKDMKRGKKYYEAAEHILNALVAGSTTLVNDMSLSLALADRGGAHPQHHGASAQATREGARPA